MMGLLAVVVDAMKAVTNSGNAKRILIQRLYIYCVARVGWCIVCVRVYVRVCVCVLLMSHYLRRKRACNSKGMCLACGARTRAPACVR
jgi:hypothetical protein